MIDLVLHAGRQQAAGLQQLGLIVAVQVSHLDLGRPHHVGVVLGQGEATLLVAGIIIRDPLDLRVGQAKGLRALALAGDVDNDHPLQHADLGRRQADARCVVHGIQHVVHQPADRVVDALDRFRHLFRRGSGATMIGSTAMSRNDASGKPGMQTLGMLCACGRQGDAWGCQEAALPGDWGVSR